MPIILRIFLWPREHKVEHRNLIKELTDEQLEAMIEYIETSLEAQAGGPVNSDRGDDRTPSSFSDCVTAHGIPHTRETG